ncbi:lipoprotein [Nibrella saemangeumensis]|uniref:Lipoprotein n=1 Tax=Nibrella saemangeumensis TaxID=1084526 RepID=A0ABP8MJT3_9BACT
MVASTDGGFLLTGTSLSGISGDKSENSKGDDDVWAIKIGANGMPQWNKTYGGTGMDFVNTAIPTRDGGFLLAGWSVSDVSGDKSEKKRGGLDCWLVKVDANGTRQWDKTLGGTGEEQATALVAMPDGGYLVGAYSFSPSSDDKSEDGYGGADYWLIKLDANGNIQFDKTLGGGKNDFLSALAPTPDGGFVLYGDSDSNSSGDKSENSKGQVDVWLVKVSADGTKQWDKTLGGSSLDYTLPINSIVVTSDGGLVFEATSNSGASGNKSEGSKGDYDYWLVKVDANGNKLWDKSFGTAGADMASALTASPDGGFLLGSRSSSGQSSDKSENGRGNVDYWLVKVGADGTRQWDKTLGGSGLDYLTSVVATTDGGFLAGGFSISNTSGEKSENSKGAEDFWIVKIN